LTSRPRIKVLRIIARLCVGGPSLHVCALTSRLDPARYDSQLIAGSEGEGEASHLEVHGLSVQHLLRLPALGRELSPYRDMQTVATLVRLMRRERPDIVHTHTAKAGAVGRLAAAIARVPIVVHTYHGHVLEGYFSAAKTRAFVAIERLLAHGTSRLIAVTPTVRDQVLERGIGRPDQFSVIPLGLDLEPFVAYSQHTGKLRAELGLPAEVPLVGIVGRLVPIKAHDLFLAAAARVAAVSPAHFVIVGDGYLRPQIETQAAALGLTPRVHMLGWRADLPAINADLDVAALSSRNEGSPVALIEAMTAERAVVSTRVGGVADVIDDGRTGLLVPKGDATALGDAILTLIRDPAQRRALGTAARASVYPAYALDRLVGDIDSLYQQLLADRRHSVP
jgi:glycosyltransferase involved in cell wall biosynthesis